MQQEVVGKLCRCGVSSVLGRSALKRVMTNSKCAGEACSPAVWVGFSRFGLTSDLTLKIY